MNRSQRPARDTSQIAVFASASTASPTSGSSRSQRPSCQPGESHDTVNTRPHAVSSSTPQLNAVVRGIAELIPEGWLPPLRLIDHTPGTLLPFRPVHHLVVHLAVPDGRHLAPAHEP